MTNWTPDPSTLKRPVYQSLMIQVTEAIERGELAPGERLPTHRGLADALGISVQTVSRAYDELMRRGFIVGEVGRGTFVRPAKSEPSPPFITDGRPGELIDLSILKPVSDEAHVEHMRTALRALADELPHSVLFAFRPQFALRRYRETALDWLELCGLSTRPENVQITNGTTPGITVALMSAARPGDLIVTEGIGHHTIVPLASYLGLRVKGLRIDGEGIVPEALEEACANGSVRALFTVPSAANPTTAMMSRGRREALVEIARRHDLTIIENDAWGPLIEGRPPPIAALAPERTLYVTSFTKCVMPGLRTGYLVAPDAMIPAVANRLLVTNWMATALIAELAARWIGDGTALELMTWQREALRVRHETASAILGDLACRSHARGLHIWLPLPPGWREEEFVSHARLQGVALAPGSSFLTDASLPAPGAVRISVGSTSLDRLRMGLATVLRLVGSPPEPALLAI